MSNRDVDINVNVKAGNANKELNGVASNVRNIEKNTKDVASKIVGHFIKVEAAIRVVKEAFKFAADGLKEFETATKGTALKDFNTNIKNIQIQIGSVLAPAMEQASKFVKENFDKIALYARLFVGNIIIAFETIVNLPNIIWNELKQIPDMFLGVLDDLLSKFQNFLFDVVKAGGPFADAAKKFLAPLNDIERAIAKARGTTNDWAVQGSNGISKFNESINKLWSAMANGTTAKFVDPKDLAAQKDFADFVGKINEDIANNAVKTAEKQVEINKNALTKQLSQYKDWGEMWLTIAEQLAQKQVNSIGEVGIAQKKALTEQLQNQIRNVEDNKYAADKITAIYEKYNKDLEAIDADTYEKKKKAIAESNDAYKKAIQNRNDLAQKFNDIDMKNYSSIVKSQLSEKLNAVNDEQMSEMAILREALDTKLVTQQQYQDQVTQLEQSAAEQRKQIMDDEITTKMGKVGEYVGYVQTTLGQLNDMNSAYSNLRNMEIDQETEKKRETATSTIKNKRELDRELAKIDKDAAEKRRKLAKAEMLMNIAMAIASGAQATINGLKTQPFFPLGIIMGGIAAVLSTIQVGIMFSQYSKMAKGGVVGGQGNQDTEPTMLTPGEIVMNRQQQANTLMAIANGKSGGGGANISIGDTQVIIQGNADETVVNNALKVNRQKQMENMRQLLKDMQYSGSLRMQVA